MRFSVYQVSRKGGREKNEDRMGYCYTRDSGLFALADGMGGHPEGEVASQLALQTIAATFQKEAKTELKDPQRFLQDAILAGQHLLLSYATDRGLTDTPRTTIVACVIQGGNIYWAHCGDSRLYIVRGDRLLARTRAHSYSDLREALSHVVPLVEKALRNAGEKSDIVTALAVEWEQSDVDDQVGIVSTRSLGEDVFASTMQA